MVRSKDSQRWLLCLDHGAVPNAKPIRGLLTPRQMRLLNRFDELPSSSTKWDFVTELRTRFHVRPEEPLVVEIRLRSNDQYDLDYCWEVRVLGYVQKMLEKEKLMWNLSTLGGAFSAMGDYFHSFADKAQQVSLEQLRIAKDLGDPVITARCRLYIAHALAQKGHFEESLTIIRREYRIGRELKSELLMNCSQGLWSKVRFLKSMSGGG
uniref:FAT domain-containing protein n=1 Tax=Steinernema glaseri TaxID=37863 RepID=A0A1I8A3D8_9BILA